MQYTFVGFKGKNNPSFEVVKELGGTIFLTNSFQGIKKDISNLQDISSTIILFGLNSKLKNSLQIEYVSQFETEVVVSTADSSEIKEVCAELEIKENRIPSKYYCNYAYYLLLKKYKGNVLLIHIPFSKEFRNKIISCFKNLQK